MGCLKRIFYVGIFPVALGVAAWQGWSWWSWATAPVSANDDLIQIQIPSGTAAQQIGQDLEAAGLIRSATAWKVWNRLQGFNKREGGLQAGTYSLSETQSMSEIADQIWNGDVIQTSFTIPEGWNRDQMADYLEAQGLVSAGEFLQLTEAVPYDAFPWLPQGLPHLEGFLYPDTYQLPSEQLDAEGIIDIMLLRFEQVALPVYQQASSPYSLQEWVNLSSIVEKESVVAEERDTIAGVFARRLREGISLGSDPTVEYGLGVTQTPENPLTLAQVNTPNPYNTYRNLGLPPTPIASPGIASLEASLNPPDTEFLYFVARYDGTHVFSRSLAEHERAQGEIRDRVDAQLGDDL